VRKKPELGEKDIKKEGGGNKYNRGGRSKKKKGENL